MSYKCAGDKPHQIANMADRNVSDGMILPCTQCRKHFVAVHRPKAATPVCDHHGPYIGSWWCEPSWFMLHHVFRIWYRNQKAWEQSVD